MGSARIEGEGEALMLIYELDMVYLRAWDIRKPRADLMREDIAKPFRIDSPGISPWLPKLCGIFSATEDISSYPLDFGYSRGVHLGNYFLALAG